MIELDGASGEGGGQILRTALSLAAVTGQAFRIVGIRARRRNPGLQAAHLAAVKAAAACCDAQVEGARLGASTITFRPGALRGGEHHIAIGTAGSTTLVLQTMLWPLALAPSRSNVVIEGGTHNPMAPTVEFLTQVVAPRLHEIGVGLAITSDRVGFHPRGGGRLRAEIAGGAQLQPLELLRRGPIVAQRAVAMAAGLPAHVLARELAVVRARLGWDARCCEARTVTSPGPGNVLQLELRWRGGAESVAAFGARGVPAERVADQAVDELQALLAVDVPVGSHLADQLMLPMALAGAGVVHTVAPSLHTRTNAEVIARFVPVAFALRELDGGVWSVAVGRP